MQERGLTCRPCGAVVMTCSCLKSCVIPIGWARALAQVAQLNVSVHAVLTRRCRRSGCTVGRGTLPGGARRGGDDEVDAEFHEFGLARRVRHFVNGACGGRSAAGGT
eukprot:2977998-Pleurochrysis_carterae.AAC.1